MALNRRRDPIIVDTVEIAADDTPMYVPVDREGNIVAAGGDAFGFTMATGNEGTFVAVCRLGFLPILAASATNIDGEKLELIVSADGELDIASTAGDDAYVVAISEEAAGADGAQTGAWIDCLSPGRLVEYGA